jgi:hypothetical protein
MPSPKTIAVTCRWCGATFLTSASALRRDRGHFCSRKCQGAAGGKRTNELHPQSGEGNHNYRHGDSEHASRYVKRWTQANPKKVAAHKHLHWLLRNRMIVKPDACEQCGRTVRLDGHHDDYRQKSKVRWLCRKCHVAYHKAHGAYPRGVGSKSRRAA